MIAGRGEGYCPECYDFLFPDQALARREREAKQGKKGKGRNEPEQNEGDTERRWF
jgi:hypothetical protein